MGRPTSKHKSGLYAMKGPRSMVPGSAMSRSVDPYRSAAVLGQLQAESGHFLASPYGAAFSVGNDDEDVWGGLAAAGGGAPDPIGPMRYAKWVEAAFVPTESDATSTFSIDVDTGSFSLMRRALRDQQGWPQVNTVRIEELINYFDYDYPEPSGDVPVSITSEVGPCPWDSDHRLVHIGLQGRHIAPGKVPPRNLVFLVDVSGSMGGALNLVTSSLAYLTEQLGAQDKISLVVYAGAAGTVLPPTSGADKQTILDALERLRAGGSTNGGEGIHLAYRLAERHFVEGGINRVVLATDGDFNVGVTSQGGLVDLIEDKRRSGVFLSVLGFGGGNYRDGTMEQLADKGNGNYAYIDGLAEARKVLVEQAGATLATIAKDVKLQLDIDPEAVRSYRLVGYDNRILADADFADDTKDAGEIGAGHTVTALYEVVPNDDADPGEAMMNLKLRYKEPDGRRSRLVEVPIVDGGQDLDDTSDDYRFAAAVAGFGQVLQGLPAKDGERQLPRLRDLARDARGPDYHCRRAQLVHLIERASAIAGEPLRSAPIACSPTEPPPPRYAPALASVAQDTPSSELSNWQRFILEVLYLLPPLLALPLFVMALRRPRRRKS